jgi:hypothetical protein
VRKLRNLDTLDESFGDYATRVNGSPTVVP